MFLKLKGKEVRPQLSRIFQSCHAIEEILDELAQNGQGDTPHNSAELARDIGDQLLSEATHLMEESLHFFMAARQRKNNQGPKNKEYFPDELGQG